MTLLTQLINYQMIINIIIHSPITDKLDTHIHEYMIRALIQEYHGHIHTYARLYTAHVHYI